MITVNQSYIICCTPRSGSHLLADGLTSTAVAGNPVERFPRPSDRSWESSAAERIVPMAKPPTDDDYDAALDAIYIDKILEYGTTANGVFGVNIHRNQFEDAIKRIRLYLKNNHSKPHEILSQAFPNLSYLWLKRRDKVAQAVSWHKALQSGRYVKIQNLPSESVQKPPLVEFDFTAIKIHWSTIRNSENAWQHYFLENKIHPFVIYYEDLCANYEGTIRAAIKFLALERHAFDVTPPRNEKAGDAQSLEWVRRFIEMQSQHRAART